MIALDHPARRQIVPYGTPDDPRWHGHVTTDVYRRTHLAAATVDAQHRAAGALLPGFRWYSRQFQADLVAVLYEPVFNPDDWTVVHTMDLRSRMGERAMALALDRAGLHLSADLAADGGVPDLDA